MLKILFKQPFNLWRTLNLRHKIEAILLFILIYAYMATRLNVIFKEWMDQGASAFGIAILITHFFTLLLSLSAVFIIRWFLPKQRGIQIFISQPFDNRQIIKLLMYYSFKYLSVYLVLFLPVLTALLHFGIFIPVYEALSFIITSLSLLIILFRLKNYYISNNTFIISGFLLSFIYHGLCAFFYWETTWAIWFQSVMIIIFTTIFVKSYLSKSNTLQIENFTVYQKEELKKAEFTNKKMTVILNFLPGITQALLEKEILSLWRNRYYKKYKIQSFLVFFVLSILLVSTGIEHKEIGLAIITCLIIWTHYSGHFNEKYVLPDPDWFIRTLPVRFRHLFFAKYFAEIAFAFILIFCDVFFLYFSGTHLLNGFYTLALIFVFSHLVLFSMLNFSIMFYDNARLAGYAYHFFLLFVVIMILNYRLVGPIITLGLLVFFLYKNVKYFNN